jgi:hypothetical protein
MNTICAEYGAAIGAIAFLIGLGGWAVWSINKSFKGER